MKELDEQKSQTDNSINLLKKQNNEDTINISNLQNEIESIKLDIEEKTKKRWKINTGKKKYSLKFSIKNRKWIKRSIPTKNILIRHLIKKS